MKSDNNYGEEALDDFFERNVVDIKNAKIYSTVEILFQTEIYPEYIYTSEFNEDDIKAFKEMYKKKYDKKYWNLPMHFMDTFKCAVSTIGLNYYIKDKSETDSALNSHLVFLPWNKVQTYLIYEFQGRQILSIRLAKGEISWFQK